MNLFLVLILISLCSQLIAFMAQYSSTTIKEIYIIRHGQTDFNVKQVVQGRGVNSDLNDTGLQQAKSFFDTYHPIDFDVIYTSKLKRTHQTVAHFLNKNIS